MPGEVVETETAEAPTVFPGMLVAKDGQPISRLLEARFPGELFAYPRASAGANDPDAVTAHDAEDDGWTLVPGIGKNEELFRALLGLTAEAPVPGQSYANETGTLYIVRLKEHVVPEGEELARLTVQTRRRLLAHRQREAYRAWYTALYARAEAEGDLTFSPEWLEIADTDWETFEQQSARGAR